MVPSRSGAPWRAARGIWRHARATGLAGRCATVLGLAFAIAAVGCGGDAISADRTPGSSEARDELTIAKAREEQSMPLFWVGQSFEGLPLTAIVGSRNGAGFVYGACEPPPGGEGGCAPPLQIQTVRMCPPAIRARPLSQRRVLRGVATGSRGGAVVLLIRGVEVRVFADAGRARRAIATMGAINPGAPGAVGPGEPLPAAGPRAEQRTPC